MRLVPARNSREPGVLGTEGAKERVAGGDARGLIGAQIRKDFDFYSDSDGSHGRAPCRRQTHGDLLVMELLWLLY